MHNLLTYGFEWNRARVQVVVKRKFYVADGKEVPINLVMPVS